MDKRILSSLGIRGNEATLYNAMLKIGKASPTVLAKMTGIKRTTAYHTARILADKGLFNEDSAKRPILFSIASEQNIYEVIKKEQFQFSNRTKALTELASEISRANVPENYNVPSIRFIEEDKLEHFLYKETPKWHKSILETDKIWWGFQDHTFIDKYGKITDWYWKKNKDDIMVKLLSNKSITEQKLKGKYPQRQIKFWNKASNFLSTTWLVGDYMVMINTRKHPFYLVEIHDKTLANDQREIFKNLWSLV